MEKYSRYMKKNKQNKKKQTNEEIYKLFNELTITEIVKTRVPNQLAKAASYRKKKREDTDDIGQKLYCRA